MRGIGDLGNCFGKSTVFQPNQYRDDVDREFAAIETAQMHYWSWESSHYCADSSVLKHSLRYYTLKWPVTEAGFLQAIYHIIGSFYEYWHMWLFDLWFFVPILCLDTVTGFYVTKEKANGERRRRRSCLLHLTSLTYKLIWLCIFQNLTRFKTQWVLCSWTFMGTGLYDHQGICAVLWSTTFLFLFWIFSDSY